MSILSPKQALEIRFYAKLALIVVLFLVVVLPISITVGLVYGLVSLAVVRIWGADPGRYVDEINLRKGGVSPLQQFLVLNRSSMVLAFVLPLSRLYQVYVRMRTELVHAMDSAPSDHEVRVQHVKDQFEEWRKEGGNRRIVTARPGWKRVSMKQSSYKDSCFKVHVDRMSDILEVNTKEKFVRVEPMVTMGQLVPELIKSGWTLPVVPELEELTVGGMIAGTGVESSSHHSGLFQEFCIELEIALASGAVVTCSKSQRPDLFECFFWSYGTLGMLMSAKLRIIPAAPYIRLEYHGFETEEAFIEFWRKESLKGVKFAKAGGNDVDLSVDNPEGENHCSRFVEGLIFSANTGVVMTGDFAHGIGTDGELYEHAKWYQPYFYKHVEEIRPRAVKNKIVEYLPLRDYYYRHSRSVFWEMENIVPLGDNPLFRWCYGWMLPPSVGLLKLTTPADLQKFYDTKHVIQDMLVPAHTLEQSLGIFRDKFDIYPLWVCPMTLAPGKGLVHATHEEHQLFVDLGAYGVPGQVKQGKDFDVIGNVRAVEHYVASVNGFEMLYADSYMTRPEFGKMFDRRQYDTLRKSLGAESAFPDIYDKIVEPKRLQQLRERFGADAEINGSASQ